MIGRLLGRTGRRIAPISFGAFKIGRNENVKYEAAYDLPDDVAVERLLDGVIACGMNLIDTAPAYGTSEERIGGYLARRRGLAPHDGIFLSTKVGEVFEEGQSRYDFSAKGVRASVARSLARFASDRLDLVLIHAHAEDVRILQETPVVETLQALKREGPVRAIGLSGKTVEAERLALEWADVLMVEYHLLDQSHGGVIAEAAERGVGVLVKKGLASGNLPAAEAIPFILGTPGVTSLVIGGLSRDHLAENIRIAKQVVAIESVESSF